MHRMKIKIIFFFWKKMKIGKDRFIFNLMKRNFENLKFVDLLQRRRSLEKYKREKNFHFVNFIYRIFFLQIFLRILKNLRCNEILIASFQIKTKYKKSSIDFIKVSEARLTKPFYFLSTECDLLKLKKKNIS